MTAYQFVATPYGNFAAQTYSRKWNEGEAHLLLTPLGELSEVPLTTTHDGMVVLDHEALDAEGRRMYPEQIGNFYKPKPTFEVNRKTYSGTLEVKFGVHRNHYDPELVGTEYAYVSSYSYDMSLSDSAREKLAAWMQENREWLLAPQFLAKDTVERAAYELKYGVRKVEEAAQALRDAQAERTRLERAYREAEISLAAIENGSIQ